MHIQKDTFGYYLNIRYRVNLRYSTFDPKVYIITCFYSVLLITDYDFSAESQVLFCFVVQMATKKFFAWLKSRSFWHLMKSRGKNKKFPSHFVQPFFREAHGVHHEWLKAKIMRRNQWKNFHLHLNCQCRVYWHIDISIIV